MRLPRTLSLILALMLAAVLPLRGYAAVAQCEGSPPPGGHAAHAPDAPHAAHVAHCADGAATSHTSGCGDCCSAAAASTPVRWIAPRTSATGIVAPALSPPPALAPDRLDRPPRTRGG
jgi:hypothetical protein